MIRSTANKESILLVNQISVQYIIQDVSTLGYKTPLKYFEI